ncbi:hypothetical protein EVAR_58007_1 [Eumeta japonica]|uniref:Uncharacterized protein n=1 Tax=Eumeta variegata TaxID=151549 RepID=A0A4C1Y7L2_EUMVA|nr:hypothetical protein EVAR_58007_1 [Eumeta japonica]
MNSAGGPAAGADLEPLPLIYVELPRAGGDGAATRKSAELRITSCSTASVSLEVTSHEPAPVPRQLGAGRMRGVPRSLHARVATEACLGMSREDEKTGRVPLCSLLEGSGGCGE